MDKEQREFFNKYNSMILSKEFKEEHAILMKKYFPEVSENRYFKSICLFDPNGNLIPYHEYIKLYIENDEVVFLAQDKNGEASVFSTDGKSVKNLSNHMDNEERLKNLEERITQLEKLEERIQLLENKELKEKLLIDLPIDKLQFNTRIKNALKSADIYYIKDLINLTERDILKIYNLSKYSLYQIKEILMENSLFLRTDPYEG